MSSDQLPEEQQVLHPNPGVEVVKQEDDSIDCKRSLIGDHDDDHLLQDVKRFKPDCGDQDIDHKPLIQLQEEDQGSESRNGLQVEQDPMIPGPRRGEEEVMQEQDDVTFNPG